MLPSLVTCPTRKTLIPLDLARCCKRLAHSRTCETLPGEDSLSSVYMVWIESMTKTARGAQAYVRMDPVSFEKIAEGSIACVAVAKQTWAKPMDRAG